MNQRLSWGEIKDFFSGEWVELTEYEWEWGHAKPRWAKVRCHATDRKNLLAQIDSQGEIKGSVIMHMGGAHSVVSHDEAIAA